MRTTLDIDAEILELAKALSAANKVSIGKAISDLARRGSRIPLVKRNGFYVFEAGDDARPFGLEEVQAALDSEDTEEAARFRKG